MEAIDPEAPLIVFETTFRVTAEVKHGDHDAPAPPQRVNAIVLLPSEPVGLYSNVKALPEFLKFVISGEKSDSIFAAVTLTASGWTSMFSSAVTIFLTSGSLYTPKKSIGYILIVYSDDSGTEDNTTS